mgnify:CR=1 FL=1
MHATISASQTIIPRVFWTTYQSGRDEVLPFYEDETLAIQRRDPERARAACADRSYVMAQTMLAELFRRRVFTPTDDASRVVAGPLQVISDADTIRGEALSL